MLRGMAQSVGLVPTGELERSKGVCASTRFIDKGRSALALVAAAANYLPVVRTDLRGLSLRYSWDFVQLGSMVCN